MAISVTDKIKEIMAARDKGIISAQQSVIDLLAELRRQVLTELIDAPGDSFTAYRLKQTLNGIESQLADFESSFKSILGTGMTVNWNAGAGMLDEAAAIAGVQSSFYHLSGSTLSALEDFTFGKISGVTGDLYNKLRGELTLGVLGQKSPAEVAATIAGQIEGIAIPKRQDQWGNWSPAFKSIAERAEVITGVEMGRAFSLATQKSGEAAATTLPGLQKTWLHAGHPKQARQQHLLMHGEQRDVDKPFYTTASGYGMQFPRDPNAPISEVIRCGCTHVFWMPEFGDKDQFVAAFDTKQNDLWTGKKAA